MGRLDTNGAVVYLTYLGGNGDDLAFALAVDAAGNAYVTGSTLVDELPDGAVRCSRRRAAATTPSSPS